MRHGARCVNEASVGKVHDGAAVSGVAEEQNALRYPPALVSFR
jgi:hypothetical protein